MSDQASKDVGQLSSYSESLKTDVEKYISERISSPLIPTFIATWLFQNSNFVIFWLFGEAKFKYQTLSNWDFSGFIFNGYFDYANSLWLPLIYSTLITLTFPFATFLITGFRNRLSSYAKEFAVKSSSDLDMLENLIKAQAKIDKINNQMFGLRSEAEKLEEELKTMNSKKANLDAELAQHDKRRLSLKDGKISSLIIQSACIFDEYLKNKDDFILTASFEITGKSLLSIHVHGINYSKHYEQIPLKDLILIPEIFDYSKDDSFQLIHSIIYGNKNRTYAVRNSRQLDILEISDMNKVNDF